MENPRTKVEEINDPSDFERICKNLIGSIEALGPVDFEYYREELKGLSAPLSNAVDPQVLARDLARIQAFKDRAVELVDETTHIHLTHKRIVEILTKGWPSQSQAKSAEKREGEALLKFSNLIMEAEQAERTWRHALGVMKNLESQQENVSRQISCAMVASNIGDRRYGKPDNVTDWDKFDDKDEDKGSNPAEGD